MRLLVCNACSCKQLLVISRQCDMRVRSAGTHVQYQFRPAPADLWGSLSTPHAQLHVVTSYWYTVMCALCAQRALELMPDM